MRTPTPHAPRAITIPLTDPAGQPVGSFGARLVPNPDGPMSGTWAITHALGSIAGGTHTEVAFAERLLVEDEDGAPYPTERQDAIAEEIVRTAANALYARSWAFTYRPEQVENSVLRYGSILRERVEITAVEVYS